MDCYFQLRSVASYSTIDWSTATSVYAIFLPSCDLHQPSSYTHLAHPTPPAVWRTVLCRFMLPCKRARLTYSPRIQRHISTCRRYSAKTDPEANAKDTAASPESAHDPEDSAIIRRLQSLAESAQPLCDDPKAGISESSPASTITDADLLKLQDRISQATFNATYPRAQAEATLPRAADKITRNIAADAPWTGEESTHDSVLRMLTDVHKPLKMPVPKPTLSSLPLKGPPKIATPQKGTGRVLAAKEASQGYSLLKEKLSPGFRAMPATMEGLASLAEERIQEARSRGQFNNLPGRGKPVEKDHLNDSAYIDRTGKISSKCEINGRVLLESDITTTGGGATLGSGSN